MSAPPPRLYNVHETHQMVRKSVSWLYQESARGTIPVTRIGRNIFWTDAQITQIIRDGAQEPQAPARQTTRKRPTPTLVPAVALRASRKRIPSATTTNIPKADRSVSRLYRQEGAV